MAQRPLISRRTRPRIDIALKANFEIHDRELPESECIITNISVSGAGLVFPGLTEESLSKGLCITLEFYLPGTDRPIYVAGDIIWIKQLKDAIAAGVNFSEPLSFEELVKCCGKIKNSSQSN